MCFKGNENKLTYVNLENKTNNTTNDKLKRNNNSKDNKYSKESYNYEIYDEFECESPVAYDADPYFETLTHNNSQNKLITNTYNNEVKKEEIPHFVKQINTTSTGNNNSNNNLNNNLNGKNIMWNLKEQEEQRHKDLIQNPGDELQDEVEPDFDEPIFTLKLELLDGKVDTINFFENSNAEQVVNDYCKDKNFDEDTKQYLYNELNKLLIRYTHQLNEDKNSNSNSNSKNSMNYEEVNSNRNNNTNNNNNYNNNDNNNYQAEDVIFKDLKELKDFNDCEKVNNPNNNNYINSNCNNSNNNNNYKNSNNNNNNNYNIIKTIKKTLSSNKNNNNKNNNDINNNINNIHSTEETNKSFKIKKEIFGTPNKDISHITNEYSANQSYNFINIKLNNESFAKKHNFNELNPNLNFLTFNNISAVIPKKENPGLFNYELVYNDSKKKIKGYDEETNKIKNDIRKKKFNVIFQRLQKEIKSSIEMKYNKEIYNEVEDSSKYTKRIRDCIY